MRHTMITKTDAIVIPAGISAPMWVSDATTWLGLGIAILTFLYFLFKTMDAWYQWMHRWDIRKSQKKLDNNK